jgi:hypothetical protein
LQELRPLGHYIADPSLLPSQDTGRWFVIHRLRTFVVRE